MITVINADDRHHADMGWLSAHWHFSFDDSCDPANMQWGPLRVFGHGGGGTDPMVRPARLRKEQQ